MREQEDRKFDDLLGEDICRYSTDKAPDEFSQRLMKRMAIMHNTATEQEREVRGGVVVNDHSLISRRGRWLILFICLGLIAFGYSLGDGSGSLTYFDDVTDYFSKISIPAVSLSFNMAWPGYIMLVMAIACLSILVLADKIAVRFINGLRF